MRRDRRLAAAIALFVLSAIAAAWQTIVINAFINTAVMGGWEHFAQTFGVEMPYGPNQVCFDYCAPDLPFLAGWVSIASFALGLALVVLAWWRPRA